LLILQGQAFVHENTQELYALIDIGRKEIYHFRFEKALKVFLTIQQKYPDFPHGYFYESYITAILFSQDKTNQYLDSLLHETVRTAVKIGERYKNSHSDDPEANYYLGISHGVLGIYHVLNKNYFKGYLNGRKGKKYLEKTVELDSAYYDAYLGLGIFHYYVDLLPGVIKFFAGILGFHGNREEGIKEIYLTANRGKFLNVEADFTHATIRYFLEGAKYEGLLRFKSLRKKYPENPALTLMVGYYYRRHGQIKTALNYFSDVSEKFTGTLPQITVMKWYNMGVCNFRMNDFQQAEFYFNKIMNHKLRKTKYYQAALAYYKGLLAGIRMDQELSHRYMSMIFKNKETEYWYNISRLYVRYPIDSLMINFIIANNNVFTASFYSANIQVSGLVHLLDKEEFRKNKSHMLFLIRDLEARLAFRQGRIQVAAKLYENFIQDIDDFQDKFHRAWMYIGFARVLREMKSWEASRIMLEKATRVSDEYTRLIIERERFILKNQQNYLKSEEHI
jgi:tetratricopeptide (TPR) repeat protein